MRKLVIGLFCAFYFIANSNVFASKPLPEAKPLRVAFYMDSFNTETMTSGKLAITNGLAINLHQKASDIIIVSVNILKIFIGKKLSNDIFFSSVDFKPDDWNIYGIKDTDFFALVLKNRKGDVEKSNIVRIYDVSKWVPIGSYKDNNFLKIKNYNSSNPLYNLDSFKNIFIFESDLREDHRFEQFRKSISNIPDDLVDVKLTSFLRPMNIVLNGHGNVGQAIAGIESSLMTEVLNFLNELHINTVLIFTCSSGGKNLDFMQFRKDLNDQKISINIKYMLIVSAISDAPIISSNPEKIKAGEAIDPSIDVNGFFQALEMHVQKGDKQSWLKKVLKKLTLSNYWFLSGSGINNIPQVLIPNVGWFQYFDIDPDIQKITDVSIAKVLARPEFESEQSKVKKRTTLKKMKYAESQLATIEVNQKLALLLYPAITTVELKFSPKKIDIENGNIKLSEKMLGVVLHKNYMPVPDWLKTWSSYFPTTDSINIDWANDTKSLYFYPSVISMQRGDALHLLSKVSIDGVNLGSGNKTGILSFIKELYGYNDISTILDIIGSSNGFRQALLSSKNKEITLKNLLIKTSFDLENDRSDIEIAFEFVDKYWNFKTKSSLYKSEPGVGAIWEFTEIFQENFSDKLGTFGLRDFAKLDLATYVKRIFELKNLYQSYIKQILKMSGSATQEKLSFKDYLLNLDFDKFEKYVTSGTSFYVTKPELGGDGARELKTKLKKLKISLGNLKFKLNELQQKLVILKKNLLGEKIDLGVGPKTEVQKVSAKEAFAIIKNFDGKKFTTADLRKLAEQFALVSNRVKDDIANKISKQKFEGKDVDKFKIEFVESVCLNDSAFDETQKLNLSYILISLIHSLYFKSTKFTKITDKFKGGDFISTEQLANLVWQNISQIMQSMNALDDSKFYVLGGGYIIVGDEPGIAPVLRNEIEKILTKFSDMLMVSSIADQSKYKVQITALNDLINSLSSGESIINTKLKTLNEKFKLLDIDMKIVFGQILVSKLPVDSARLVWTEILKLLNLTQNQQSIWKNSQLFDLYGLGIAVLLKYYPELNDQIVGYFGSRIFYELQKNTDYNNVSKYYFYFSCARFFEFINFNVPLQTNPVIKNILGLNIKELYRFEVAFACVSRYKTSNPDLYYSIKNSDFHKNLEITKFDTESFTLKYGNQYFYKDLNSLRFAFNLTIYFLMTEFDTGKNSDWIINGVFKSSYLHLGYKEQIKAIILDGIAPYFEILKARLAE
ncbi:MAG: hypothetical protein V1646_03195 [bacterium]